MAIPTATQSWPVTVGPAQTLFSGPTPIAGFVYVHSATIRRRMHR
jgi:hypothetical protein